MEPPSGLAERGSALWEALTTGRTFDPAASVLVAEACRIADRLERLDGVLSGDLDTWLRIDEARFTGSGDFELKVDSALSEARQQANALRQIVVSLGLGKIEAAPERLGGLDDLLARRAARDSAATA